MDYQSRQLGKNEQEQGPEKSLQSPGQRVREVQVTGTAEVCCPADRASVRVRVCSSKECVQDASSSVCRRLDYILQTIRHLGVPDTDTSVRKLLQREGDQYRMDAEVLVLFSKFEMMEQVCSVLLEKMDTSVCVGPPQFYHSREYLGQMRLQACAAAVEAAQQKARGISQVLGHALGPPLLVREEETREWRSEDPEEAGTSPLVAPLPRHARTPAVAMLSRVSVSFSLQDRSRKNL